MYILSNVIIKEEKNEQKKYGNLTQKKTHTQKNTINYRFTSKTKTFLTISHFIFCSIFFCFCQFYQIKLKKKMKKKQHTFNKY